MLKEQNATREMIGLREYARRVGISYTKAYEFAREDRLLVPVYRDGSRWLVSAVALEALVNRQHESPQQAVAA